MALAETYKIAPQTFVDAKIIIKELRTKNKTGLLRIIEKMIQSQPASLSALGIKEFLVSPVLFSKQYLNLYRNTRELSYFSYQTFLFREFHDVEILHPLRYS